MPFEMPDCHLPLIPHQTFKTMQTKQLGNSDLQITPLGIGAWAMGVDARKMDGNLGEQEGAGDQG